MLMLYVIFDCCLIAMIILNVLMFFEFFFFYVLFFYIKFIKKKCNYLDTLPSSSKLRPPPSVLTTYKFGSITLGIGLISVPSSCSIR